MKYGNLLMSMTLTMDRPIDKDKHYISPGGYEFIVNGQSVQFDFCDSIGYICYFNPCKIEFVVKNLDLDSFPNAEILLRKENIEAISRIEEFFVYTGETDEPEINVVSIDSVTFSCDNWNDDVEIPKSILEEHNKTLWKEA